jgi:CheY-like chemotaxis protein
MKINNYSFISSRIHNKEILNLPFTLLSDPVHLLSKKFVEIVDIGPHLTATAGKDTSQYSIDELTSTSPPSSSSSSSISILGPNIGFCLLDKNKNILQKFVFNSLAATEGSLNRIFKPQIEMPNVLEWLKKFSSVKPGTSNNEPNSANKKNSANSNKKSDRNHPADSKTHANDKKKHSKMDVKGESDSVSVQVGESREVILIVDDSSISSRVAAKKINSLGFDADIAYNGQTAHEMILQNPHKYSFIMLDICMPVCDGILLYILRRTHLYSLIVFLFLT